jgi:late competence protein required for DNA uptake (superfamily II DNA/RNA helicase)
MRYTHAKCMNQVASKTLLTKSNHAYEFHQITKIRLHSNGRSQVKCVRKLSRDADIASLIRCGPRSAGCSSIVWLKTYTRDQLWHLNEMAATVMQHMRWTFQRTRNSRRHKTQLCIQINKKRFKQFSSTFWTLKRPCIELHSWTTTFLSFGFPVFPVLYI